MHCCISRAWLCPCRSEAPVWDASFTAIFKLCCCKLVAAGDVFKQHVCGFGRASGGYLPTDKLCLAPAPRPACKAEEKMILDSDITDYVIQ